MSGVPYGPHGEIACRLEGAGVAVHAVLFRLSETFHLLRVGCRKQHVRLHCARLAAREDRTQAEGGSRGACTHTCCGPVVYERGVVTPVSGVPYRPHGETACRLEGADVATHPVPFRLGETFHLLRVGCGKQHIRLNCAR